MLTGAFDGARLELRDIHGRLAGRLTPPVKLDAYTKVISLM